MKRIVIATHNSHKAREMLEILEELLPEVEFRTLAAYPRAPEPEETGSTYEENATIKSLSASFWTGEWALADDAGLEIDALGGAPGVHSKRFEGESTSFPEKMRKVLEQLADTPDERRTARFRCWVALSSPGGDTETFEATCEGRIAREARGTGGFGYDPIFFLPELGRHMAELSPREKHAVSHRGKVLRKVAERIRELRGD